jgi:protein KTI12
MPSYSCLIILCGVPCTGKSRFAEQLKESLISYPLSSQESTTNPKVTSIHNTKVVVHIVKDESPGINKVSQHSSATAEKVARAHIKAGIERHLTLGGKAIGEGAIRNGGSGGGSNNTDLDGVDTKTPNVSSSHWNIVIADGLNYIKGFRYELYCLARTASASYCCVWVGADAAVRTGGQETGISKCLLLNSHRKNEFGIEHGYKEKDLRDLYVRFEAPDDRNRWDSPLVRVIAAVLPNNDNTSDESENHLSTILASNSLTNDSTSSQSIPSKTITFSQSPFLTSKFDLGTVLSATERSESSAVRETHHQTNQYASHHRHSSSSSSSSSQFGNNTTVSKIRRGISQTNASSDVADMRDFDGINTSTEVNNLIPTKSTIKSSFKRATSRVQAKVVDVDIYSLDNIQEVVEELDTVINKTQDNKQQQGGGKGGDGSDTTLQSMTTALSWEKGITSICALTLGRGRAALMPVQATSSLPTFSSSSLANNNAVISSAEDSLINALEAGQVKAGETFTFDYEGQMSVTIKLKRIPKNSNEIKTLRREYERFSTDVVLCGSIIKNEGLESFALYLEDAFSR